MGLFEEAKIRLSDIQKRINRVKDAGEALNNLPATKSGKTKFRMMFATVPRIKEEFEEQISVVIKHLGKPERDLKSDLETDSLQVIREKFEEAYFAVMIVADEHLPVSLQHPDADKTFISESHNQNNFHEIPLEKLSIPKFAGDPKQYTGFRNLFDTVVHLNTNLRPVVKFSYLKAYLEDEALTLISNLMLSDDNYNLALKILDKRYANRRIIGQSHLNQLWKMQKATFGDSKSIRQMINTITESVGALTNQKYAVDQWDPILLHLFEMKLDSQLRAQWELLVDTADDPSVDNFLTFLTKFCNAAFAGQSGSGQEKANKKPFGRTVTMHASKTDQRDNKKQFTCQVCKATPGHLLIACPMFKDKTPKERYQVIKELRRCFLCFSAHMVSQCKHTRVCSECKGRHHSLLHFENNIETQPSTIVSNIETQPTTTVSTMFTSDNSSFQSCVLMSTIAVLVQDASGQYQEARALLDSGSQSSFITEHYRNRLGLTRNKCSVAVQAMAGLQVPPIKARTQIIIRPVKNRTPQLTVDAFILPRITGLIPTERVLKTDWFHIQDLDLADPRYNEPLPIDILLGADVFPYIISGERREGTDCQPVALKTVFGWALMGRSSTNISCNTTSLFASIDPVDKILRKFWEIEELPAVEKTSLPEQKCEEIYRTTTTRQSDGRYIVHLPFIHDPPLLGESYNLAFKRLTHLESRLSKSIDVRQDYNNAMQDYLDSGHMNQVDNIDIFDKSSYYIPHHAVLKPGNTTTKLRVVYDASAESSNGKSLNDNLFMGPKLQQDLPGIVLRFRLHAVVFTTDIKQMFRQIVVTPEHRKYQRLLFRFQQSEPVKTFEMTTVTFGQRSSPFLAIRTLHQLAQDEAKEYPKVTRVIHQDLYVDDVATGADSEEEALELQRDIIKVFKKGQFELRKWSSNAVALLKAVPPEHRQNDTFTFDEPTADYTKVLGLKWEPNSDTLSYQYQPNPVRFTKRAILSEIARIYDPIGLLTPVITNLKRLMKYLWSIGVGWDDKLPDDAIDAWTRYHKELPLIGSIRVPRRVTTFGARYEVHGFCDSSESAYAAAVYLLSRETNGTIHCQLLMGKSKVAPEKKLSIPRLELCGALLLARCLEYICTNLRSVIIEEMTAWSDSTVVLAWIRTPTVKLKTFVANRVAKIQHMTSPDIWRHVPTTQNPADCASRGVTPKELVDHAIWWNGPVFLTQPSNTWPSEMPVSILDKKEHQIEEKQITLLAVCSEEECRLLFASGELPKVLRLTAYLLRVRKRLLRQPISFDHTKPPGVKEMEEALHALVRWVQKIHFSEDLKHLKLGTACSNKLRLLNTYLDPEVDLLRVGGRLRCSDLPYKVKHPILLPKQSQLTILLIDYIHRFHCHPGAQTTQNILLQKFWIISARSVIRNRLRQCIPCFQSKPKAMQPTMGDLPRPRLMGTKAFAQVGVDFAGPFLVKSALLRRVQTTKGYLCIFVCMATRAVHLELVSDLSTALFLAALHRFVSRRGRCTDIYSDCGTNFVGAKNYLNEVNKLLSSADFANGVSNAHIRWHLNPPAAPHMGGLWEAAVKSAKTLLYRTIKEQVLTYEELNTVFHRVEAILNSRPLGAMSSDPNDLQPLTAGHFLTMDSLVTVPAPDSFQTAPRLNLHQRWTLVQRIQQHFWDRWSKEYLHTISIRSKWNKHQRNLEPGDLVIIKEATPPLTWKTARVLEVHPGDDGVVRVATVRTANRTLLKRPVVKLCPLPIS